MGNNVDDFKVKHRLNKGTIKALGGFLISGCLFAGCSLGINKTSEKIKNIQADLANISEEFANCIQFEKFKAKQKYEANELTYIEYMKRLEKIKSQESVNEVYEKLEKVEKLGYLNYASALGLIGSALGCVGFGIDSTVSLVSNGLVNESVEINKNKEDEKEL